MGQILSLSTCAISPQFHVIHDAQFPTVSGALLEVDLVFDPEEWNLLLNLGGLEQHSELIDSAVDQDMRPFEDFYDNFLDDDDDDTLTSSSSVRGKRD